MELVAAMSRPDDSPELFPVLGESVVAVYGGKNGQEECSDRNQPYDQKLRKTQGRDGSLPHRGAGDDLRLSGAQWCIDL